MEFSQSHLVSLCLIWFHLDSLCFAQFHLDSLGLIWIYLISKCFHLDSFGLSHLVPLGLIWFHIVSLGLIWTRQILRLTATDQVHQIYLFKKDIIANVVYSPDQKYRTKSQHFWITKSESQYFSNPSVFTKAINVKENVCDIWDSPKNIWIHRVLDYDKRAQTIIFPPSATSPKSEETCI